jgi:asparagine synthetase B (glutamine-hydrolysing)
MPGVDHINAATPPAQCPVHKKKSKSKSSPVDEEVDDDSSRWDSTAQSTPECSFLSALEAPRSSYQSRCKILLVGIGADEQLAGYSRHRTVYQRGGMEGLVRELNMDTARIYNRNLGR